MSFTWSVVSSAPQSSKKQKILEGFLYCEAKTET